MTSYFGCAWRHDTPTDPVYIWTELDEARHEVRKVEQFADGVRLRADLEHPDGETGLSWVPVPSRDDIAQDPQFNVELLSAGQFEEVWITAEFDRIGSCRT